MSILDPRLSSFLTVVGVLGYYYAAIFGNQPQLLEGDPLTIFAIAMWLLVFTSAWGFSTRDVVQTAGVDKVYKLSFKMQLALFIFSAFVGVSFTGLVIIGTETVMGREPSIVALFLLLIMVFFLTIYPLVEFRILGNPGEDSSLPAEFFLERFLERLTGKLHSATLAALFTYVVLYVIPIGFLAMTLRTSIVGAIILWALIFPMINLGALAGTGLGEDLLRLRLIRKKHWFSDFNRLGWPKISFTDPETGNMRFIPKFEIGGVFLVLLAFQAILTTTYFTISNINKTFVEPQEVERTTFIIATIGLVLLNKGRGALKELLGVWREGGFKVNVLPILLAAFVLMGVILSSILEMFIGLPPQIQVGTILGVAGMGKHRTILAVFLAIQNIIFIFSALYILFNPPSTAEARLVREVPKFYNSADGWGYFYEKLRSDRANAEMLSQATKLVRQDRNSLPLLLRMIKESFEKDDEKVVTTAAKSMYILSKNLDDIDGEFVELLKAGMNSSTTGAQIYAMRAVKHYLKNLGNEEIFGIIDVVMDKFEDEEVSVRWEATQILRTLLKEKKEYAGYILSLVIKRLSTRSEEEARSLIEFLHRASKDNYQLGQMAISTLTVYLSSLKEENFDVIVTAIRQIVRARPTLGEELDAVLRNELASDSAEHRANAVKILSSLIEYRYGNIDVIVILILSNLNDPDDQVRKEVLYAFQKSVQNLPHHFDLILTQVEQVIDEYTDEQKAETLILLQRMAVVERSYASQIYQMVKHLSSASSTLVRAEFYDLISIITPDLENREREEILNMVEEDMERGDKETTEKLLKTLSALVRADSAYVNTAHRMAERIGESDNPEVELAWIELLGVIGERSRQWSEEIFGHLEPLTQAQDWRVRAAAYSSLINAVKREKTLQKRLLELLPQAFMDGETLVRQEVINYTTVLLKERKAPTEEIVKIANSLVKSNDIELQTTGLNLLQTITEIKVQAVLDALKATRRFYEVKDSSARSATIRLLKTAVRKLEGGREFGSEINRELELNMNQAMKAANNSSSRIRRTAYEAITVIAETLPESRHGERGRRAIKMAIQRQEKDPALQEYLDECRIRTLVIVDDDE